MGAESAWLCMVMMLDVPLHGSSSLRQYHDAGVTLEELQQAPQPRPRGRTSPHLTGGRHRVMPAPHAATALPPVESKDAGRAIVSRAIYNDRCRTTETMSTPPAPFAQLQQHKEQISDKLTGVLTTLGRVPQHIHADSSKQVFIAAVVFTEPRPPPSA